MVFQKQIKQQNIANGVKQCNICDGMTDSQIFIGDVPSNDLHSCLVRRISKGVLPAQVYGSLDMSTMQWVCKPGYDMGISQSGGSPRHGIQLG